LIGSEQKEHHSEERASEEDTMNKFYQACTQHNAILLILALITTFSLISCGASSTSSQYAAGEPTPPSEEDAWAVFQNTIEEEGRNNFNLWIRKGVFDVAGFRKTNGQMMEQSGVKLYSLEYEVELECLGDYDPSLGGVLGNQFLNGESCEQGETLTRSDSM
jgi:hypothetical protein